MNTQIVYEFPLNERIRVFMRLEQLFQQLSHFMLGASVFDKRAAISVLLDILTIFSRSDLKSELIKELDRHTKVLNQLAHNHGVDDEKLQEILAELNQASRNLYSANGKIGISVMESDLFQSISQRNSIPGGSCSFDLPAFHYWLEQDELEQQKDLERWTQPFVDIRVAIDLILASSAKAALQLRRWPRPVFSIGARQQKPSGAIAARGFATGAALFRRDQRRQTPLQHPLHDPVGR